MRLVFVALLAVGGVGLAFTALLGLAAGSEMVRQCPSGTDCPDARSVTAMALTGGAVCAAMMLGGATGLRKSRGRGR